MLFRKSTKKCKIKVHFPPLISGEGCFPTQQKKSTLKMTNVTECSCIATETKVAILSSKTMKFFFESSVFFRIFRIESYFILRIKAFLKDNLSFISEICWCPILVKTGFLKKYIIKT